VSEDIDTLVIGGGVIGLAVARALARSGREVIVLERHLRVGEETSSRNSEVIHAGIYYPTHSLKARLCLRGRELLYAYCVEKDIPHRRCGKLIVACATSEIPRLEALQRQAQENGVCDLELIDRRRVGVLEPAVRAEAGLWSPSTGILDSHALLTALCGDLEAHGGHVALGSRFLRGELARGAMSVVIGVDGEEHRLTARRLVNAAGLAASEVARKLIGMDPARIPATRYAKGTYFTLSGARPFRHLVYPLPDSAGLGIHATLDLAGGTRFGPDVEWVPAPDYTVDAARAASFASAIRRYWPALVDHALIPGYAGVRPKLCGPGEPAADFVIQGPQAHACPGLVNLYGLESPGLTAALAVAEQVCAELG
jgi:L-2-hydroxyglutarate oxidase LhgO